MVNKKNKMNCSPKSGDNKGLRKDEECMLSAQPVSFGVQPNVNVNVNIQTKPFGVVQKTDTIYFDIPKEETSPSLQALPISTIVMDTIDLQDGQ